MAPLFCVAAKPCARGEAIRAETEASSLANWAEVHRSYKAFAQCDDGAISEGYSDSVARLLSVGGDSFGELNRLVEDDRGFERFILRHIDELMSPAQAQTILDDATLHCPLRAGQLCKAVVARVRKFPDPDVKRETHRWQQRGDDLRLAENALI